MHYLIPGVNNPSGYQGVDFCWALQAHADRIVTCITNSHGCLTSGADMLVKLWTYSGEPLGVLVQSVPVGRRNQKWELMLDAEAIMRREDEELDEIIEAVDELVADPEKPNILDMDFSAMEPGANAEDFTRSELRQRIEQSSAKLGINFPVEGEENDEDAENVHSLAGSKSLEHALHELRSTHVEEHTVSIVARREESEMTRKRREKKFEDTSKKYEKLAGMKVGPPGTDSGVLDRDIDLKEIAAMTSKAHGHGAEGASAEPSEVETSHGPAATNYLDEGSSVDFNDLQSLVSSLGLPGSVYGIGASINNSIHQAAQKGRRTKEIAKTCKKYENWAALENALRSSTKEVQGGLPPRTSKSKRA